MRTVAAAVLLMASSASGFNLMDSFQTIGRDVALCEPIVELCQAECGPGATFELDCDTQAGSATCTCTMAQPKKPCGGNNEAFAQQLMEAEEEAMMTESLVRNIQIMDASSTMGRRFGQGPQVFVPQPATDLLSQFFGPLVTGGPGSQFMPPFMVPPAAMPTRDDTVRAAMRTAFLDSVAPQEQQLPPPEVVMQQLLGQQLDAEIFFQEEPEPVMLQIRENEEEMEEVMMEELMMGIEREHDIENELALGQYGEDDFYLSYSDSYYADGNSLGYYAVDIESYDPDEFYMFYTYADDSSYSYYSDFGSYSDDDSYLTIEEEIDILRRINMDAHAYQESGDVAMMMVDPSANAEEPLVFDGTAEAEQASWCDVVLNLMTIFVLAMIISYVITACIRCLRRCVCQPKEETETIELADGAEYERLVDVAVPLLAMSTRSAVVEPTAAPQPTVAVLAPLRRESAM